MSQLLLKIRYLAICEAVLNGYRYLAGRLSKEIDIFASKRIDLLTGNNENSYGSTMTYQRNKAVTVEILRNDQLIYFRSKCFTIVAVYDFRL